MHRAAPHLCQEMKNVRPVARREADQAGPCLAAALVDRRADHPEAACFLEVRAAEAAACLQVLHGAAEAAIRQAPAEAVFDPEVREVLRPAAADRQALALMDCSRQHRDLPAPVDPVAPEGLAADPGCA